MKKIYCLFLATILSVLCYSQNLSFSQNDANYVKEKLQLTQHIQINKTIKKTINSKVTTNFNCMCLLPRDSSYNPILTNTDDASAQITLPFNFCFYGVNYNSCNILTNGNVQFSTNSIAFNGVSLPTNSVNIIAPFWTDIDTRGTGLISYKITSSALIVKWDSVGYYNNHTDKINTFQLIITNNADSLISNGNNVSFCYGDMQWTTGDASMGVNGFPASSSNVTAATVGVNEGNGIDYYQIGTFAASGNGYNGPYNAHDSVDILDNMQFVFNTCGTGNVAPFTSINVCDTTVISPFQIITGEVYVYAPEITQTVTVNYTEQAFKSNSNAFSILNIEPVIGGSIIHYQFDASQVTPGSKIEANINGNDSYGIPASYSRSLYFKVQNLPTTITEEQFSEKPYVFPNPASTTLYVSKSSEPISVKLYDIYGNLVSEKTFEALDQKSLSIEKLSSGYYFAEIYSNQKLIRTQKTIINH